MDIIEGLKTIPSTRYQGSKRKILPWIYDCIKDVEFNTVLDAFGGSGMVSYLFKCMGKSVTYNDLYRYNCIIGESFVANNKVRLTDDDVEFILQPRVVSQRKQMVGYGYPKYRESLGSLFQQSIAL